MHHGEDAVVKAAVEASNILNDYWFKMAYDAHCLDGEKPYDKAEAMWIPGCLVYAGEGWSRGVLHTLEGSRNAVFCEPGEDGKPSTQEEL